MVELVNGKPISLLSNGSGYPELDQPYEPKSDATNLNDYRSYTTTLKPNALELLTQVLSQKQASVICAQAVDSVGQPSDFTANIKKK